jgi:hypothetical protein
MYHWKKFTIPRLKYLRRGEREKERLERDRNSEVVRQHTSWKLGIEKVALRGFQDGG